MDQEVSAFYSLASPVSSFGSNSSSVEKDALSMLLKLDEGLFEWERGLLIAYGPTRWID